MSGNRADDAEYIVTPRFPCYPKFHFQSQTKRCGIHSGAWPCPEDVQDVILAAPVPHETEAPQRALIACDVEPCEAKWFGEYRGHQPAEIAVEIIREKAEQNGWGRGDGTQDLCPIHSGSAMLRAS
ncbi:hypothetical protein GCM10025867_50530 (plasmid) [Frondihabitans sucicola]|uniref:Uncharacterized protein n=1 Tax=Frondihabitans sucicola TaxID=1268041 RepID=A0ABM8GWL0_9MICO|nr:hypothetical protein [Frondihabitans sucicola]BDZ52812.1 hypothetical protein GCM10025867_50530 [Frondihabitans sucicola]